MTVTIRDAVAHVGSPRRPRLVLDGLDLTAPAAEITAVVGPSGSGKTSLLRAVAGLLQLDAGSIEIGGRDVTDVLPAARRVGLCFQDLALFPHFDVAANIGIGLRARGTSRGDTAARVSEVAGWLDLSHLLQRRPAELSGGEAQRVALARAIAGRPDVLLLDEPFDALDPDLRATARALVRRVQRQLGLTVILVTHDPLEALTLADHLVVLLGGKAVQAGGPEEVAARPRTPGVARLTGHPPMNVLGAVGVRPHLMRITRGTGGRLDATVESVEPWGNTILVRARTGQGEEVNVFADSHDAPDVSANISLTWDHRDEHRFEEQT